MGRLGPRRTRYSSTPEPQIAGVGPNVYAVADGVALAVSHDAGITWKSFSIGRGSEPWITAAGANVLISWETKGNHSIVYAVVSTNGGVSFTTKVDLSLATSDAWAPMTGISGNTFFVGWRTYPGGSRLAGICRRLHKPGHNLERPSSNRVSKPG